MLKQPLLSDFRDIIEPRRKNRDTVGFMTKYWVPQPAYKPSKFLTPADIKSITFENKKLNKILDQLSSSLNKDRNEVQKEVYAMLEEIGLEKKMFVVRSLGMFTIKVLCRLCTSVFVNERKIFALKASMGSNPVVFVPTHRSYADFVLMTYICYCYDIELPAVAAGMDFHSMVGMGRIMRDTCAFYIRRTFATDKVYGAVFRQYVRTLVTNYHAPLSFFIEGTRSRSQKSMAPKYGFMSMVLEPLFINEIPDVTFVPVSINYDRVLEEKLFSYEMLGVPKPKESTSGLFKALSILSENFGYVYVNFGDPISAKDYFGKELDRTLHAIKPVELYSLTDRENKLIQRFSHEIIYRQQSIFIITTFQLAAVAVTLSLHNTKALTFEELCDKVIWLSIILKKLGGNVFDYNKDDVESQIKLALETHKNLVRIDKDSKMRLVNTTQFLLTEEIKKKMKGHQLSEETMSTVIPIMMLQLYVNPVLFSITTSAFIYLLIAGQSQSKGNLLEQYKHLRMLFKNEFPINDRTFSSDFEDCLIRMKQTDVLDYTNDESEISLGNNNDLQILLRTLMYPFITCLYRSSLVISKEYSAEEKFLIKSIQEDLEWQLLNKSNTHPYCLSLDTISNCLQGLVAEGCLIKQKTDNGILYRVDPDQMTKTTDWIKTILPDMKFLVSSSNPVIMNQTGVLSRL